LPSKPKLDRAFDSAFEALQNAEAIRAAEDDIRRESEFLFRCYSDPMYVMPDSTASDAAPESAQSDFPHSLQDFRSDGCEQHQQTIRG